LDAKQPVSSVDAVMPTGGHRFEHFAMATTFEAYVFHRDKRYASQAASAAFEQIDATEQLLSYFIATSEVSQINRLKPGEFVQVSEPTLACLEIALAIHRLTRGAFDITVGSMLEGRKPWDKASLAGESWRPRTGPVMVGSQLIEINQSVRGVAVLAENVEIDLGGIGKGFALDEAAKVLAEWGIELAMLSAGGSTMLPIGAPEKGWRMRLLDPRVPRESPRVLGTFRTFDRAVSMSSSEPDHPHILNPSTGEFAAGRPGAWALSHAAAWSDAMSTAFLVMDESALRALCREEGRISGMLLHDDGTQISLAALGEWEDLACEPNVTLR